MPGDAWDGTPKVVRQGIEAVLRRCLGPAVTVVGAQSLSHRVQSVTRLALDGPPGTPPSVIVKHVPEDRLTAEPPSVPPEFSEEQIAHRFLRDIGAEAGLKAELLGFDSRGFTVMADLGVVGNPVVRTYGELTERIARALATLHGRTLGRAAELHALRASAGLGEDRRHHGPPAEGLRARHGANALARLAQAFQPRTPLPPLERELERVIALVEESPRPTALVHDDLGGARQTFEIGDVTYLLDFEYAHFAPPAVDLCKPMLGKFELNVDTDRMFWVCPGFELDLAERHRQVMAEVCGWSPSDEDWQTDLSACLVYSALTLVCKLDRMPKDERLEGTVYENLKGILQRLDHLLAPCAAFPSIKAAVHLLHRHIHVG